MNIDQLAHQVESLQLKIKSLKYKFHDKENEADAEDIIAGASEALDEWIELVTLDEQQKESEE